MVQLSFGTLAVPGPTEIDLCCYLSSIREFGGPQADAPLLVALPEGIGSLSRQTRTHLTAIGAQLIPVTIERAVLEFPLGAKVTAAAALERICPSRMMLFADRDSLLLHPPAELADGDEPKLAYRPVHHRLIGQRWLEEPDAFWRAIYRECGLLVGDSGATYASMAGAGNLPFGHAMRTHLGEEIAPYVNAGCIAVDCKRGHMRRWDEVFRRSLAEGTFSGFYANDQRYAVFLHQALLTAIIIEQCKVSDLQELPATYNYPLHLHEEVPPDERPTAIPELVLARTEDLLHTGGLQRHPLLRAEEAGRVARWLERTINETG